MLPKHKAFYLVLQKLLPCPLRMWHMLMTNFKVLQNLLKYFNGTVISAFIIPSLLVLAKNLALNLNELESVMRIFDLLSYRPVLPHQDLIHYLFVCYLFQLHNK